MTIDDARPIALIGLMGAGKSTVAREVGERLGVAVADLDALIEAESGLSISRMFERDGETGFRRRERELLERALAGPGRVLACGGGVVLDPDSRELLRRRCRVVWLEVSPAAAARRLAGETAVRPLLDSGPVPERLAALLVARQAHYESTAHVRIDTTGLEPGEVAAAVIRALAPARPAEPRA